MTKSARTRKKAKAAVSAGKPSKAGSQTKAAKYVGHLLELHKLQGMLLVELSKEV